MSENKRKPKGWIRQIRNARLLELISSGKTRKELATHFGVDPSTITRNLKKLAEKEQEGPTLI